MQQAARILGGMLMGSPFLSGALNLACLSRNKVGDPSERLPSRTKLPASSGEIGEIASAGGSVRRSRAGIATTTAAGVKGLAIVSRFQSLAGLKLYLARGGTCSSRKGALIESCHANE